MGSRLILLSAPTLSNLLLYQDGQNSVVRRPLAVPPPPLPPPLTRDRSHGRPGDLRYRDHRGAGGGGLLQEDLLCCSNWKTGEHPGEQRPAVLEKDLTRLSAPLSRGAEKFPTAANYGELAGSVEKCENRYRCPLKLDAVQTLFQ